MMVGIFFVSHLRWQSNSMPNHNLFYSSSFSFSWYANFFLLRINQPDTSQAPGETDVHDGYLQYNVSIYLPLNFFPHADINYPSIHLFYEKKKKLK